MHEKCIRLVCVGRLQIVDQNEKRGKNRVVKTVCNSRTRTHVIHDNWILNCHLMICCTKVQSPGTSAQYLCLVSCLMCAESLRHISNWACFLNQFRNCIIAIYIFFALELIIGVIGAERLNFFRNCQSTIVVKSIGFNIKSNQLQKILH